MSEALPQEREPKGEVVETKPALEPSGGKTRSGPASTSNSAKINAIQQPEDAKALPVGGSALAAVPSNPDDNNKSLDQQANTTKPSTNPPESPREAATSAPVPPTFKTDIKKLLKPERSDAAIELHSFTLDIQSLSISNFTTLYPFTIKNGSEIDFQDYLCQVLGSHLDMQSIDVILSVITAVSEERGSAWFNVDIKAWIDDGQARPPLRMNKRSPCVKVMFAIARIGEVEPEDEEELAKAGEDAASPTSPGKSYGLNIEDDGDK